MNKILRYRLALIAATALLATPYAQGQNRAGNTDNGKKLFVKDGCYQCHGYQGQGGVAGARLAPRPIALVALIAYVRHPTGQMPPYTAKVLSDAELADIHAYLASIPTPPAAKNIPLLSQ